MYAALLSVHICGAVATAAAGAYALSLMHRRAREAYRGAALFIAVLAVFEVATGTALSAISASVTERSICGNIAMYLSFVAAVETMLYFRMRKAYPAVPAAASFGACVAMVAGALALGL